MEKKQSGKVTISLPTSGKKRWRVYISPWIFIISSTAEFKIIDSYMLKELILALRCSFCNNGTLAIDYIKSSCCEWKETWFINVNWCKESKDYKRLLFCVVNVTDEHTKPKLEKSLGAKFKDNICAEFCLKLWFENDWYFRNVTESGWFWKRLPGSKVPNNHFLQSVWKSDCPEVHCRTLDSYFQSND